MKSRGEQLALDPSQWAFCSDPATHIRLLAPAGCGKTLSLLYRCKNLVETARSRPRFLIVTFTVAATVELKERLEGRDFELLRRHRDLIEITTLNAWGFRRIKSSTMHPKLITAKDEYHFAVLNQLQPVWRSHAAVANAITTNRNTAPRRLMDIIDIFKSLGFDHVRHTNFETYAAHLQDLRRLGLGWKVNEQVDALTRLGVLKSRFTKTGSEVASATDKELYDAFFRFWRDAVAHLIDNATFTLEDQKYFAYLDERKKTEEGSFLSGAARYDHVLVDEFQDINPLDLALIRTVVKRNRSTLTIVGDDDQAIFEWRGATPQYILEPDIHFNARFKTYTLATNYRSPENIVRLSQRLIKHNRRRVDKDIRASQNRQASIQVVAVKDLWHALDRVYEEVMDVIQRGGSPSRVAILGRKRAQIIPYQIYFASREIPFCAAEDLQVFMSITFDRLLKLLAIKDRAHARRLSTEVVEDVLSLCDFVKKYPLGRSDRHDVRRYLGQTGVATVADAIAALGDYSGPLKGPNYNRLMSLAFAEAVNRYLAAQSVTDALLALASNFQGLQADLGKAEDDIFYADPPFLYLADYATRYDSDYSSFIADLETAKRQLAYVPPYDEESEGHLSDITKRPVHLMTALRAKGKEFDSVVLLDVNDGIWPNRHAETPEQLEAERRVFYVAFTRARCRVLMTVLSRVGGKKALPSPYLSELGLQVG